jgi:ubiquinone/menaquinone biosynthesis C-methylase UbiE
MEAIRRDKKYKVNSNYLTHFLEKYWYMPSDVLQRGIEANVWDLCLFQRPILDIGIGNGKISNFIFKNNPQIDVGIDSDESGLKNAKRTKKYIKILHANAENMPFENASFNTVVSNSTFEHIVNDFKAISEVARVLKNDGLFFTTVPSEYLQKWVLEYEEKKNMAHSQENLRKFNIRANHLHYRSLDNWKKYLKKNNLETVFYKYYFPKKTALLWYKLFKKFTHKLSKREIWSIIGDSRITKFIPKNIIIKYLRNVVLKDAYKYGFFMDSDVGAQLFMIARKV